NSASALGNRGGEDMPHGNGGGDAAVADAVNTERLAALVRDRVAANSNLREAAKEAGVSPATLSRIQRGHTPDIDALLALIRWLRIPIEEVLADPPDRGAFWGGSTPEKVAVHLAADPALSPQSAELLARVFTAIYQEFIDREASAR